MRRVAAFAATILALVACTQPAAEVDHSRIVTLSGDLTEIVYELGAGDSVVGVDLTTVHPPAALELPIVGVGRFITSEGVLGERPTLVLADEQSGPLEALEQMRAAGVSVEVLAVPTTFEGLYEKIRVIGDLLGRADEADDLVGRLEADVEQAIADATETGLRVAYVYTRGPDVVLLFGQAMTTNPIIEAAGAIDAGADTGIVETVPASAEALVSAVPDVIIVPEEGLEILGGLDAFLTLPGIAQTPAGENRAVLVYPEGDFLTFGPRIDESLRQLIHDLAEISG